MRRLLLIVVGLLLCTLVPGLAGAITNAPMKARPTVDGRSQPGDPNKVAELKLDRSDARQEIRQASTATSAAAAATTTTTSIVGDEKFWLAVDFQEGFLYLSGDTPRE